jgi:hypothetical protein
VICAGPPVRAAPTAALTGVDASTQGDRAGLTGHVCAIAHRHRSGGRLPAMAVFAASGGFRRVVPDVGVRLLVAQGCQVSARTGSRTCCCTPLRRRGPSAQVNARSRSPGGTVAGVCRRG